VRSNDSVSLETAAELARVDARTIRQWAAIGAIEIEWRGDRELVRLDRVKFLASAWSLPSRDPGDDRRALRGLLGEMSVGTPSVRELQQLARARD
jgi:hypothetical protein